MCVELVFFGSDNHPDHDGGWTLPAAHLQLRALAVDKSRCPRLGNYKWIFCGGDLQKCLPQLVVSTAGDQCLQRSVFHYLLRRGGGSCVWGELKHQFLCISERFY